MTPRDAAEGGEQQSRTEEDEIVRRILQPEQVAVVFPLVQVGNGDERFDRAVAGPGAVAGQ